MLRPTHWQWLLCIALVLASGPVLAEDKPGQELLDKATEIKLGAERVADLNQVIDLCHQALKAGLDETNQKFANELLASTLTQRASLICLELFERPVTPNRAGNLVRMALSDLDETIKLDSEQAEAQYLIGRLYAHLGQRDKALKALDAAVRLTPDDPAARAKALMVRANLKTDDNERLADYDEAVKLQPKEANTLRFRGMYHFSQTRFEKAVADFDAAIAIDANDAQTHEARGLALAMLEKHDEAMKSFDEAIALAPESPTAYVHRGRLRAQKGDNIAALVDAEQALKLQPGSLQARLLHAGLLSATGDFEKALEDLNLLRQVLPDSPEILLQIALVQQAAKRPREAIEAYDAVVQNDPNSAMAYRGRADAHLSLGEQKEAVADYSNALEIEPDNSGVLNNLAWVLATSPDDELRDGKRAIELAQKACEKTEYKQSHILSTLAAGYAETGDFENAIKWSKKAVEISPEELKSQLGKELASYEGQKPWREATPPADVPDPTGAEETAQKKKSGDLK
jgi:tetratricopeptide (TPR) repeat protein